MGKPAVRGLDRGLLDLLCDEIDAARRWLETLAVDLCIDEAVFLRHAAGLQGVDAIVQTLGEIVMLLRHDGDPADALAAIRLDTLRDRLTPPTAA